MASNPVTALTRVEDTARNVSALSGGSEAFEIAQRMAKALATSTIVPEAYRGNIANVMVAMEYANRLGASVLAVMQNLDVINGRPSLRSTFLIGTVNATGRFTPLRWRWQGKEGTDDWGCRTIATDNASGEECPGPLVTIRLAKAEGWYGRKGSKWQTLPELMLMYRAAGWWTRLYCPELGLGLSTDDELSDMVPPAQLRARNAALALDTGDPPTVPATVVEDVEDVEPVGAEPAAEKADESAKVEDDGEVWATDAQLITLQALIQVTEIEEHERQNVLKRIADGITSKYADELIEVARTKIEKRRAKKAKPAVTREPGEEG